MKASKIALVVLMFVSGIISGVVFSKLNGDTAKPTPGASPELDARLDRLEAGLGELTAALNRIEDQRVGEAGQPTDKRRSSANEPDSRHNEQAAKSPAITAKFEETKSRMLNSLHDPATNITTLMNSSDMRSLSTENQNEVMQEIAARLDSGQLNKEQFLPGYKPKAGAK